MIETENTKSRGAYICEQIKKPCKQRKMQNIQSQVAYNHSTVKILLSGTTKTNNFAYFTNIRIILGRQEDFQKCLGI